jgi:CheY-like chemotaxis protein
MKMANILVAEDDSFLRQVIRDFLVGKGHTVMEASNGLVAREIAISSEIELIISDIQMPGGNGVEFLEWSKAEKPLPFILMTGFTDKFDNETAETLGVAALLRKPFRNSELLAVITNILKAA